MDIYKPYTGVGSGQSRNPLDPKRCHVGVWSRERWSTYAQCSRKGAYDAVIDGKPVKVCAIHRPDAVAEREAAKQARYDAEQRKWARQHKRPTEYRDALRSIANGHNDPRSLAREALEKWSDLGTE